jgi:thiamine biosynthesis protein ThiS
VTISSYTIGEIETVFPGHSPVIKANTVFVFMKLIINGEAKAVDDGLTLAGLLEQLQIRPGRVVVERNRDIVNRECYASTVLADGDTIEIVHFVGGG